MAFNEQAFRSHPESFDIRVVEIETTPLVNGKCFVTWKQDNGDSKPGILMIHKMECLIEP